MHWYLFTFYDREGKTYEVMHYCRDFEFAKGYAMFAMYTNNYVCVTVNLVVNLETSETMYEFNAKEGEEK